MKSEKKTEPLALTLEQLIEEPREEISAVASAPIPKEELEDTAVAVPTEKPYRDTIAVEKINPHAGGAESELPPEIPPSPEETEPEIISSTQNTATGQAPRLLTRLETFQKNAEKAFASKVVSPITNAIAPSLPTAPDTAILPPQKPETKGDISPTLTLEKLETFLFTTRQKN